MPLERDWPLFGLRIKTPRLTLAYPSDPDLDLLNAVAKPGNPPRGKLTRPVRLLLTRQDWQKRRRDDIEIPGLEPCLPMFGLDRNEPPDDYLKALSPVISSPIASIWISFVPS